MAVLVQGFMKLQIDTSENDTPTFVDLPGVTNVAGGGRPANDIDTTDFDTPPGEEESIPGTRPNTPFTFDLQYMPGNVTQEILFTKEASNTPVKFRVKAGTKGTTFPSVPGLTLSAQVNGKVMYSGSIKPLTAAVRATIS